MLRGVVIKSDIETTTLMRGGSGEKHQQWQDYLNKKVHFYNVNFFSI
jgi:hypothetical protein